MQAVSSKGARAACLFAALAVAGVLAALLAIVFRTPPIPSEWQAVRPGMKREEVLRIVPDVVHDMRELKGFDIYTRRYRLIFRPCWWQMEVFYNERNEAVDVWFSFTDPNCGLFNKNKRAEQQD